MLITLAVLAVTTAQLFWIYNAYQLQNKNFRNLAQESLQAATAQIEADYGCFEAFNKINLDRREGLVLLHRNKDKTKPSDTVRLFSSSFEEDSLLAIQSSFSFPLTAEILIKYHYTPHDTGFDIASLNRHNLSSKLAKKEMDHIFSGTYPVTYFMGEEFFTNYIDSFLALNLEKNGITAPYYFLLREERTDTVILSNFNAKLQPDDGEFVSPLYKGSYFFSPQNVYLWFPEQSSYLLGKMGMVLLGSFLVLILLFAVAFTMSRTLLRQKKLSQMKNDFINNMTHEFKTPISNISLALETVNNLKLLKNDTDLEKFLGIIDAENARLAGNVEKILQISNMEQKEVFIEQESVHLDEVLHEVMQRFEWFAEQKGGRINLQISGEKPLMRGDKVHLTNLFYNLIDNALKYNHNAPVVDIHIKKVGDSIEVRVADNGIGIPNGECERIFDRFYRVPTGNVHDVKGFGLGLSYVKAIVDAHRGHIRLKSAPGKGSVFTVLFSSVS